MQHALAISGGVPAVTEQLPESLPLNDLELDAVMTSLKTTPLTTLFGGHYVERFERTFAEKFGYEHAVAVSSGTSALHAALAAVGVQAGDEVIATPHSFIASVSVIVQQGAVPVFCDLSPRDLGIDIAQCERLITPRTKAVLPVHVYGVPMNVEPLADLCRRKRLALIEDCAAALGAKVGGKPVGSFGTAGCFSFNIGKVLRTGEGGMVVARDSALAAHLRELRVNGLTPTTEAKNSVASLGFNYTLNQPAAALGCATLTRIDDLVARRADNRAVLLEGLQGLPLTPVLGENSAEPVGYWTAFILDEHIAERRDWIVRAAQAEGVRLFKGFGEPLYTADYLKRYADGRSFPVAESLCPRIVAFDPAPFISRAAMEQVVRGIRKVMRCVGAQ